MNNQISKTRKIKAVESIPSVSPAIRDENEFVVQVCSEISKSQPEIRIDFSSHISSGSQSSYNFRADSRSRTLLAYEPIPFYLEPAEIVFYPLEEYTQDQVYALKSALQRKGVEILTSLISGCRGFLLVGRTGLDRF